MLLTVPQAAERLELSRQRVHKLVVDGRIKAQRVGRDYMIESSEITRFKRIPRNGGRRSSNHHHPGSRRRGAK